MMQKPIEEKALKCKCGNERFYAISNVILRFGNSRPGHWTHECTKCGTVYDDWGFEESAGKESVDD